MNKSIRNIILLVAALFVLIGAGVAYYVYSIINTGFNIDKTVYVYVDQSKDFSRLLRELQDSARIDNVGNFALVASYRDYADNMKTGRYAIKPGADVWTLVNSLNRGQQAPVRLTFNNIRLKEDLTQRLSSQLMFSNGDLARALDDLTICDSYNFTPETIVAMFIPNTYEFYWDVSVDNFLKRMNKEYKNFWTSSRMAKAQALDLTPLQVSTLASIVEEECMFGDEYPIVAGLYLNRLRRGQLLQADPTVKYAVGDFSLQRILNKHLTVDSPYNTYKYQGLPPSPIRVPSIRGIDAVLNYGEHNFLYMCAKEDFSGRHNFAASFSEHQNNANKYRNALNQRGIY